MGSLSVHDSVTRIEIKSRIFGRSLEEPRAAAVSLKVPQPEEIRDYTGVILGAFHSQPFRFSRLTRTLVFVVNERNSQ